MSEKRDLQGCGCRQILYNRSWATQIATIGDREKVVADMFELQHARANHVLLGPLRMRTKVRSEILKFWPFRPHEFRVLSVRMRIGPRNLGQFRPHRGIVPPSA